MALPLNAQFKGYQGFLPKSVIFQSLHSMLHFK
jgi:hypothetical protein